MRLSLDSAIDLFLDHVKVERGLARNSVLAYGRDLAKFRRFAAAEGLDDAEAVEPRHLLGYLVALSRDKIAARSQARNLVALRQLFRHLRAERYLQRDPTADLELPKIGRPLPVVLTLREVEDLLSVPRIDSARGLRDAAMLETLYATGLRVSELVGLREIDVNLTERFLSTVGKGKKQRLVPLGGRAHDRIVEYLASARPSLIGARQSPSLFVTHFGRAMTPPGLLEADHRLRAGRRHPQAAVAAQAAPLVRHPPGRAGRRPARRPGHARPRRHRNHANLYPRLARPPDRGGQKASPAGVVFTL